MGLTLDQLLPDYKASLLDAASVFKGTPEDPDADFKRHLGAAARVMARDKRPRTLLLSVTLQAGVTDYDVLPDDFLLPKISDWGVFQGPIWHRPRDPLPIPHVWESGGARILVLSPAPTSAQINAFGATYRLTYLAAQQLTNDAATSTVQEADRDVLLLRALIEAVTEMVNRNLHKPVQLSPGSGSTAGNSTPAAWRNALLQQYREAA
ncbi:MAG TPA: hypothetical protein VFL78_10695 [Rhodanobacteraceae bacterium]|nr:hypothetical protein [Rhodanobacteraceae bacterium]